jgi:hypothetical protein
MTTAPPPTAPPMIFVVLLDPLLLLFGTIVDPTAIELTEEVVNTTMAVDV